MIPYRDPAPAYWAHVRAQERTEERRRAADLRPDHEILAEIAANHRLIHRSADTRGDAQITADLLAYMEANPITAEQRAEDAAKERARLRAIDAPARARWAKARAKAKAEATAKRRAKALATERRLKADAALAARNPGFHGFLKHHGLRGRTS